MTTRYSLRIHAQMQLTTHILKGDVRTVRIQQNTVKDVLTAVKIGVYSVLLRNLLILMGNASNVVNIAMFATSMDARPVRAR